MSTMNLRNLNRWPRTYQSMFVCITGWSWKSKQWKLPKLFKSNQLLQSKLWCDLFYLSVLRNVHLQFYTSSKAKFKDCCWSWSKIVYSHGIGIWSKHSFKNSYHKTTETLIAVAEWVDLIQNTYFKR